MRSGLRMGLAAAGLCLFAGLFVTALWRLPDFGHYQGPYGDVINARTVPERHATDAVSAVNFDYRGLDTLGEEFILFASVLGALVLLRQEHERHGEDAETRQPEREVLMPSDAVGAWTRGMTGPTVVYGFYIVTHGQLTPGGGFQGGVILATAPLLVFLGGNLKAFKRITSHVAVEVLEGLGAGGFVLIGFWALARGKNYLTNVLPLGEIGDVFSGGTIPLVSVTTGLEVAAGFVLLLYAYLQDTLQEEAP